MSKKSLLVIVSILTIILSFIVIANLYILKQKSPSPKAAPSTNKPPSNQVTKNPAELGKRNPVINLTPKLNSQNQIELWINPIDQSQIISTIALKLALTSKGKLTPQSDSPIYGPNYIKSKWNFPFGKLYSQGNKVILEVAAIYVSTKPYELASQGELLLTIPLETLDPSQQIEATIDPYVSLLTGKKAESLHFINEDQSILVE